MMSLFKKFGKQEETVNTSDFESRVEDAKADFEDRKDEAMANFEEKKQQVDNVMEKAEKAQKIAGFAGKLGKAAGASKDSKKIWDSTSTLRNAEKTGKKKGW